MALMASQIDLSAGLLDSSVRARLLLQMGSIRRRRLRLSSLAASGRAPCTEYVKPRHNVLARCRELTALTRPVSCAPGFRKRRAVDLGVQAFSIQAPCRFRALASIDSRRPWLTSKFRTTTVRRPLWLLPSMHTYGARRWVQLEYWKGLACATREYRTSSLGCITRLSGRR